MKKWFKAPILQMALLAFAMLFPAANATANTDEPIVLVHGFLGFGPDEMLGYNYWGGFENLKEQLESQGYTVHVAAVGPVSSSWDRAAELYAQILGTAVDYGKGHSAHMGHERYDPIKQYPGFYPEWDENHPIHLIGHSQGGQTVRALAQLMAQGHPSEAAIGFAADNESSPLFAGRKSSWIKSVTTISSPHDGTTIACGLNLVPFVKEFILSIGATAGLFGDDVIYDFKLGQWGLIREPGQSFSSYAQQVVNSEAFKGTLDSSDWDMDPLQGAQDFNQWVQAQPDIYYFSWATEQSKKALFTKHHVPELRMNMALAGPTYFMGTYTDDGIDSTWFENDGVVNTISMDGPKRNSSDIIVKYTGSAQKGKWNYMGTLNLDHGDIVGILPWPSEVPEGHRNLSSWYFDLAAMLTSLP